MDPSMLVIVCTAGMVLLEPVVGRLDHNASPLVIFVQESIM